MLFLGNLWQVRQLWQKLPEVANPALGEELINSNHLRAFLSGAGQVITGPSRAAGRAQRLVFRPLAPDPQRSG